LINTVATAVPLSAYPSPLVITTKLAAAILGVPLFGGGALSAQYYPVRYIYLIDIYFQNALSK